MLHMLVLRMMIKLSFLHGEDLIVLVPLELHNPNNNFEL